MSDIPVMKKIIGTKDFYIINNKYYIVVKDMACRSCAFRKGLDNCIVYNTKYLSCFDIIGNNSESKKCFKEYKKGGI